MKRSFQCTVLFLFFSLFASANDGEYSVIKIAPQLLKNAHAVLRLEELHLDISSARESVFTNHWVITILDENGDHWADFSDYYDQHREILSVEGYLYDMFGKQLKKMKKKDLVDNSATSSGTMADDNRSKEHNFYYKVYPYTVEYTVEVKNKASLFFPSWSPQGGANLSVEKSSMEISCPIDYKFRYKAFHYDKEPVISDEKNTRNYVWSQQNMPAIVKESFSPLWHEITTYVIFGPTEFQMDEYKGNMQNWQDFGKFVYSLKAGRDQLPDNIKQKVHQIADGQANIYDKIRMIYEYMQQNTRYISIQLGIGGWQPFDAKYVATKGYGDCKALTNYMYSLLKEAGIPSYYTLIRGGSGSNYITDDFPSQQFNHVILCVPLQTDSIWLECTSQTDPAGYLGNFTSNRYALMIDENGGKLVRTPKYSLNENLQSRHVAATLDEEGTLILKAATHYGGLQQDEIHGVINYLSKEKVKEYLHEQLDFATYDVSSFDYKEFNTSHPSVDEALNIRVSNYATITGKRLFILPNIMTRSSSKISRDSTRKYDIQLGYEYRDVDSVEIKLPEGYTPEALPADINIDSKFGTYSSSVKLKGTDLFYYRRYEHYSGRFPAKDYADMAKFSEAVFKADRGRVVLVKK